MTPEVKKSEHDPEFELFLEEMRIRDEMEIDRLIIDALWHGDIDGT